MYLVHPLLFLSRSRFVGPLLNIMTVTACPRRTATDLLLEKGSTREGDDGPVQL